MPALSHEELQERLTLTNTKLVAEVYGIAKEQIQFEAARQGRLDTKATSLFAAIGLSLTVAFTFGGYIVAHGTVPSVVRLAFFLATFAGMSAAFFALWALFVRASGRGVTEDAIFSKKAMEVCDAAEADVGVAAYRRFLTVQFWEIARTNRANIEAKAKIIKLGQGCFGAFLFVLGVICFFMVKQ